MTIRWKKLLISIAVWIVCEVGLTWIGLDDLADCSEYISKHREVAVVFSQFVSELPIDAWVIPRI